MATSNQNVEALTGLGLAVIVTGQLKAADGRNDLALAYYGHLREWSDPLDGPHPLLRLRRR